MDVPTPRSPQDPLAHPARADLFRLLGALRRPASTPELAERLGRHPNGVRAHLERMAAAGLVCRRTVRRPRGRPRDEWAVSPDARPGGRAPEGYGELARWLARAVPNGEPRDVEEVGRRIGAELAPERLDGVDSLLVDAFSALGFRPLAERRDGEVELTLRNCPYRDAVAENPQAICRLHRGLTRGILERRAPDARLTEFVARDPYAAGCLVKVVEGR